MDQIVSNIKQLYDTYGNKIKSEKHLILVYMQKIDGCRVDKENLNTVDFINSPTDISDILSGYRLYKILRDWND